MKQLYAIKYSHLYRRMSWIIVVEAETLVFFFKTYLHLNHVRIALYEFIIISSISINLHR